MKNILFRKTEKDYLPVNSYNEWDPLEEIIVGIVDKAMFPSWNVINRVTIPPQAQKFIYQLTERAGTSYPQEIIEAAQKDLEEFVHILEAEGVIVRRPDVLDYALPYRTPDWQISNGFCAANPRDVFLVVGNEIIEAPMADRGRYFEAWAYRSLLKEYFQSGAKWTAAPKPQLLDAQYDWNYQEATPDEEMRYIITEFEPTFDAADFVRCGRDLFVQRSHVTNDLGIMWLQRHLGDNYKIHVVETLCRQPMHIDTTLMPLAPGKVLVNPEFIDPAQLPSCFKNWDILIAPKPMSFFSAKNELGVVSDWMSMNVLMLDEERVVVEKSQESMIRALKGWGFKPILCSFENYYPFAGSFHCATLDVRRNGRLQSYF